MTFQSYVFPISIIFSSYESKKRWHTTNYNMTQYIKGITNKSLDIHIIDDLELETRNERSSPSFRPQSTLLTSATVPLGAVRRSFRPFASEKPVELTKYSPPKINNFEKSGFYEMVQAGPTHTQITVRRETVKNQIIHPPNST